VSEGAKQVLQEDRRFAFLVALQMLAAVSDKGFETLTKVIGGRIDGHGRASSLVEPSDGAFEREPQRGGFSHGGRLLGGRPRSGL